MGPGIKTLASLVTVGLLLAGCINPQEEDPAPSNDADNAPSGSTLPGTKVAADEAAVGGRVITASLDPLPNVTVVVQGTEASAVTDTEGRYLIEHLEPGEHKVFAQAPGYALNLRPFTMEAGQLSVLNFIMDEVAGEDPYVEVLEQSGFLECQLGAVVLTMNCVPIQNVLDDLGMNPTNTEQILKWEFETAGLQALIFEMVWEPPVDGTGEELQLLFESDSTDLIEGQTFGSAQGPSPVRLEFAGDEVTEIVESNATEFQTRTFPPFEPGHVVFMQKFTIFVSLFYHSLPLPGYTGVPDGYVP